MSKEPEAKSTAGETEFSHQVGEKAERKLKAQRHVTQTVWAGLGMMGLVGWAVAVPTLLGAALGLWMDKHYPGQPFLDTHAAGYRPGHRLYECVALGGEGRQGNTRARGE